jgi:diaminohydroxyphosphoribosylaminopyrimidine deaminase/5-amino-6-(5-phosphoribosylamino)uracil reductase
MAQPLTAEDAAHIRHALELAEGGFGRVSPNPMVGAVIVRDGAVIGEGFHAELGALHAETAAIADCRMHGADPHGATLYVTLEPCAHTGRQPPCTKAILEAGIARVVVGSDDPSEKARGRGMEVLRRRGVEVAYAQPPETRACRLLNQPFRKQAKSALPWVLLKLALTAEGSTTPPEGTRWISSERSRKLAHRWRAGLDAVAIGIGTVLADDPLLTARGVEAENQPARVIFDSTARLPLDSKLVGSLEEARLIVIASPRAPAERVSALEREGVEVLRINGETPAAHIAATLPELAQREIQSVLLEGGLKLAGAFRTADAIDAARIFVASGGGDPEEIALAALSSATSEPDSLIETSSPIETAVEAVDGDTLVSVLLREW